MATTLSLHLLEQPDNPKWERARKRAQRKLRKLAEQQSIELFVFPLGRQADGIAYYLVVTDHSAYVCGFYRDAQGRKWAGCECMGGLGDKHCYHVEAAVRKHVLWVVIERSSERAAVKLSDFAARAITPLLRHATAVNGGAVRASA